MARRAVLTHGDSVERSRPFIMRPLECSWDSVPVIVLVLVAAASHDLTYTVFAAVLAVGGNEEATELSGINTRRTFHP